MLFRSRGVEDVLAYVLSLSGRKLEVGDVQAGGLKFAELCSACHGPAGKGNPLMGRLLRLDSMDMTFREYKIPRDPNCPVCGKNPTVTKLIDYLQFCGIGRGEDGGSSGDSIVEQTDEGLGPD